MTATCFACREPIHELARKCHKCQAWQGWRRYVGQLTILSCFPLVTSIVALVLSVFFHIDARELQERVGDLESNLPSIVFERWKEENQSFINGTGKPGDMLSPISILWYQFFENGSMLYNASSDWTVALFSDKKWEKYENPVALITHYDPMNPNLEENIRKHYNGINFEEYLEIFRSKEKNVTGGIGTLYVKHDLFPRLGRPVSSERAIHTSGYVSGPVYDLLVGLVNTSLNDPESRPKAVYALMKKGGDYKKFVVFLEDSR